MSEECDKYYPETKVVDLNKLKYHFQPSHVLQMYRLWLCIEILIICSQLIVNIYQNLDAEFGDILGCPWKLEEKESSANWWHFR